MGCGLGVGSWGFLLLIIYGGRDTSLSRVANIRITGKKITSAMVEVSRC